jgi:hypothetical protein
LAFIDAYTRVNLKPPAEVDIQRRFGVTPPSVHQMILTLERDGLIRRRWRQRSFEVLVPLQHLPLLEMPPQPVKTPVPSTSSILAVLILTFGPTYRAHFNPAVSLVFASRRELPWRATMTCMGAQVLGGILGVSTARCKTSVIF